MTMEFCTIYDCEFNDYFKGVIKENTVYIIDKTGNLAPAKDFVCEHIDFDRVQFFIGNYYDDLEENNDSSKWGYFELSTGKIIVQPTYEDAYPFYGDRAKVQRNGKFGFVDPDGKIAVNIIWDDTANAFHDGLCWVKAGEEYGYVDKHGLVVFSPQFEKVGSFQKIGENLLGALVKKDGKYGYVNEKGHYILEPVFEKAKKFWIIGYKSPKGLAPVMKAGKWGFMDHLGNIAVPFQFDNIGEEKEFSTTKIIHKENVWFGREYISFYTVKKDGQWGLMISNFEVIMPETGNQFVVHRGAKIYIRDGKITRGI